MTTDDTFARWASLFAASFDAAPTVADRAAYTGVTPAAAELLQAVDAGGLPAFVTNNLLEIARENGLVVPDHWTPNEIVEALREKAVPAVPAEAADAPGTPADAD